METDIELLELAAKAAWIEVWFPRMNGGKDDDGNRIILTPCHTMTPNGAAEWNPLTDDGDALRLAVNLRIDVDHGGPLDNSKYVCVSRPGIEMMRNPCSVVEEFEDEMQRGAATRRAIVRAAAAIGREKQNEASNGN